MKLWLIFTPFLFALASYGQDSIRTKNDKPGTPKSLRIPDNTPRNQVHTINTNTPPAQTINHGAVESNQVNNSKQSTIITNANPANGAVIPPSDTTPKNPGVRNDTMINNALNNKSNVTSPIRR